MFLVIRRFCLCNTCKYWLALSKILNVDAFSQFIHKIFRPHVLVLLQDTIDKDEEDKVYSKVFFLN